jgi:hypothetical protein
MAAVLEVKYFNSFWIKKVDSIVEVEATSGALDSNVTANPNIVLAEINENVGVGQKVTINGDDYTVFKSANDGLNFTLNESITATAGDTLTFGQIEDFTYIPLAYTGDNELDWFVEEARIRGGYNNTIVDLGVKAYLVEDNPQQQHRFNSLIYSGIFNSRTGINRTNEFSVAEDITRSLDPYDGSIQKLYAENTNLTIFQEFKVSSAIIDKDLIYTAEGQPLSTTGMTVIGPIQAYAGNYGIGKNPESFAVYGFRKYFVDKNRSVVLRLSNDGISEISSANMTDFFRDNLALNQDDQPIYGMWDMREKLYVLNIKLPRGNYKTLTFDEDVAGWTSLFSYSPDFGGSLRDNYYTFKNGNIWEHYSTDVNFASFYGTTYDSTVQVIFNPEVSMSKMFKTFNYEGSAGWKLTNFYSETDRCALVLPYVAVYNLADLENQMFNNNFKKKENKYFTNLINITNPSIGNIVYGGSISGIKGFFATASLTFTNTRTKAELFAVSSEYENSLY